MTELTALRQEAQRLAETWNNVAGIHLAAGQGCACAVGGVLLSAADFELDIVEFVLHEAQQANA
ncbi:MAG TPA: hypothetical protein VL574_06475, partial [Stellaceae bacterium]|nr:hypothetical protein [Stellaceae bacterium]